jgi:hypothetical protein
VKKKHDQIVRENFAKMSSRFSSPSPQIVLSSEPVDLGSETSSSCSLSELDSISHLLRKIPTDINEIKGMKAAILTVEANLFDLNVRVSQNEAKISSLEVKMNEYSTSTSESNRQLEDFQEGTEFESQSRATGVKIIGFLRNIEKGKLFIISSRPLNLWCVSTYPDCSSSTEAVSLEKSKYLLVWIL